MSMSASCVCMAITRTTRLGAWAAPRRGLGSASRRASRSTQATQASSTAQSSSPRVVGVLHGPHIRPDIADDVLSRIDAARTLHSTRHTVFSGTGTQLGLDSTWRFVVSSDGSFREEIVTEKFTTISGYDASSSVTSSSSSSSVTSRSWSGDQTGMASYLAYDDDELTMLVSWARSGLWSSPAVRPLLVVDVISTSVDEAGRPVAVMRLRMKDGRVTATATVDLGDSSGVLRPRSIAFHLRSDNEALTFLDWDEIEAEGIQYPRRIEYETMSGTNVLCVEHAVVRDASVQDGDDGHDGGYDGGHDGGHDSKDVSFSMPVSLDMPLDTEFREPSTHELPAWVTTSGHILVKATIDGDQESAGYWLFDTGASGSVIDSAAAAKLGLESFGSFKVKGMAGDLPGNFRSCRTMELGPLKVNDMMLMEMDCSGLVRGGPGPVLGIIGCDILSRAVWDIPRIVHPAAKEDDGDADDDGDGDREVASFAAAMAITSMRDNKNKNKNKKKETSLPLRGCREIAITMTDPRITPDVDDSKWMDVRWVSSLPHLDVTCVNGDARSSVMFMVDSGAGGMQLMMNNQTAWSLLLCAPENQGEKPRGTRTVRGVGGSSTSSIRLRSKRLRIAIGHNDLTEVDCLVADDGIQGGVELSHYTGGVLCNDVLVRYRFVIDLPRDRLALL